MGHIQRERLPKSKMASSDNDLCLKSCMCQTFQPLSHANLEVLKTSPEKPGDWDLKPGDFQNMCQIIKKALFV